MAMRGKILNMIMMGVEWTLIVDCNDVFQIKMALITSSGGWMCPRINCNGLTMPSFPSSLSGLIFIRWSLSSSSSSSVHLSWFSALELSLSLSNWIFEDMFKVSYVFWKRVCVCGKEKEGPCWLPAHFIQLNWGQLDYPREVHYSEHKCEAWTIKCEKVQFSLRSFHLTLHCTHSIKEQRYVTTIPMLFKILLIVVIVSHKKLYFSSSSLLFAEHCGGAWKLLQARRGIFSHNAASITQQVEWWWWLSRLLWWPRWWWHDNEYDDNMVIVIIKIFISAISESEPWLRALSSTVSGWSTSPATPSRSS